MTRRKYIDPASMLRAAVLLGLLVINSVVHSNNCISVAETTTMWWHSGFQYQEARLLAARICFRAPIKCAITIISNSPNHVHQASCWSGKIQVADAYLGTGRCSGGISYPGTCDSGRVAFDIASNYCNNQASCNLQRVANDVRFLSASLNACKVCTRRWPAAVLPGC